MNFADIVILIIVIALFFCVTLKLTVFKGPKWHRDLQKAAKAQEAGQPQEARETQEAHHGIRR